MLGHLLRNAAEHGADTVTIRMTSNREARHLTIHDNGHGVSIGNAPRVFDPFFTTRRDAGGTGMGLTVVRAIMLAHHADVSLEESGSGTVFRMDFQLI